MPDPDDPQDFTKGALDNMKRAAPERADALQKLFDDHSIRVLHTSLMAFRQGEIVDPSPRTMMGTIQFPPVMHTLAWLLVNGGWEAMRNYGSAIIGLQMGGAAFSGADVEAVLAQCPETARCDEIIDCAVQNVRGTEVPPPSWLPNINETDADPDKNVQNRAVQELWLIAECWFLLHEIQHILLEAEGEAFADLPTEELACDSRATAWLLDGVNFYSSQVPGEPPDKVRAKRAKGILVGLFCIGLLSAPDGSPSHPPLNARVKILLEQVGTQDSALFWAFAIGLLFVLSKERKTIQFPANVTTRDIALRLAETV